MFAKVFTQILDSSLAEDWQTRHVFEDLLKLCDVNGVVDITHESIARKTNVPLEIVKRCISELEKPDPRSRNPEHEGRRIVRLDDHRDWGWLVVNYEHYRNIASDEQRREKTRLRVQRHRQSKSETQHVTHGNGGNAGVTDGNASNAMQKQRQKQKDTDKDDKASKALPPDQSEVAKRFETALAEQWVNDAGKWISRIKTAFSKCERIIAEIELAAREGRINTTPAQYAEQLWKEFV